MFDSLMKKANTLYDEYNLNSMPEIMQRNSLKHYYLSIYPGTHAMDKMTGHLPTYPDEIKSIYIHTPYCSGTCDFCSYVTIPIRIKPSQKTMVDIEDLDIVTDSSYDKIKNYFENLKREFNLHKKYTRFNVSYVYFGGGSPNLIPLDILEDFLLFLTQNIMDKKFYGTFELHPEIFNNMNHARAFLKTIYEFGVTRVSIGYQFNDEDMLKTTKRRHETSFMYAAINLIKEIGFIYNLDLMYGLPEQSLASWYTSLTTALSYNPDSLSTYFLFLNEGVTLQKKVDRGTIKLPSYKEIQLQKIMAVILLEEQGYLELPNDFFCKVTKSEFATFTQNILPSKMHTLPIGVGSYGFINGLQYCNSFDIDSYFSCVQNNTIPIWMGKKLSGIELLRRDIMFSFKNSPYIDLSLIRENHGESLIKEFDKIFLFLTALNLIQQKNDHISLTNKGKLCVEEIASLFAGNHEQTALEKDTYLIKKHAFSPRYPTFSDIFPTKSSTEQNNQTITAWLIKNTPTSTPITDPSPKTKQLLFE